ncbi:MAG: pilus assembly protein N-terminal domain-containing protein [Xanthobacteraceae bacterium]
MTTAKSGNSIRRCRVAVAAILIAALAPHFATASEAVTVQLDQARIMRLPEKVSTIVVGNPLIADVSLQAGGLMVLTGKGYGITNLVALDRQGTVLSEMQIKVQAATDSVVIVYRGDARESYSCTPSCEPRLMLGDTPPYFDANLGQAVTRSGRAQGQSGGGASGQGGQTPAH